MSELVKIVSSRDIHELGTTLPIRGVRMRIVKKVVRHDYTTYFLEPVALTFTRWGRIKRWFRIRFA